MGGRKELRSVRLGLETTPGTPVVPRYIYRGMADMPEDMREPQIVEELVGIFGGTDRSYIPKLEGSIKLGQTELTFEQAPLFFAAAGMGSAGGSAQGVSGSAVDFQFPIPTNTLPTTQAFTIEAGDNVEAEQLTYALVNELTLTFQGDEAVKVESTWVARSVERANAVGSFSAVGTLVSPAEVILSGKGSVFMNPAVSGATFGATRGTPGNILGGQISFKNMWTLKHPIDSGQLYFSTAAYVGCEIEGELTYEHWNVGSTGAAGSAGQKQAWRDQAAQLMELRWAGGTIPTGTTYQNKLLDIKLPIKYTKFDPLDDQEGNGIVTASFVSHYNEDVPAAGRGTIQVVRRGQLEHL